MRLAPRIATAVLATAGFLIAPAPTASAGVSTVHLDSAGGQSRHQLGGFRGAATYDDATRQLLIMIENTSSRSGRLTGLAFDVAGSATAKYADGDDAGTPADEDAYDDARGRKGRKKIKAKPFAKLEAGAALDGKLGSKKGAGRGVATGQGRTFAFEVVGDAAGLTAEDFFRADSVLVASFAGFEGKRRVDMVTGKLVAGPTNPSSTDASDPLLDDAFVPPPSSSDSGMSSLPGDLSSGDHDGTSPSINPPTGRDDDSPNGAVAVPLPPAAWAGLVTLVVAGLAAHRRRLTPAGHLG